MYGIAYFKLTSAQKLNIYQQNVCVLGKLHFLGQKVNCLGHNLKKDPTITKKHNHMHPVIIRMKKGLI